MRRLRRLLRLVQRAVLPHHRLGIPHRRLRQIRNAGTVLAALSLCQRARRGHLDGLAAGAGRGGFFQGGQKRLGRLGGEVLEVVVVDLEHGGVDAGAEALDLDEGEEAVLGGVAGGDAEVLGDGVDDLGAAAAAELARCLES